MLPQYRVVASRGRQSTRHPSLPKSRAMTARRVKAADSLAKRVLDVAGASVVAIIAIPVMVLAAAAIRLRLGSPVLFRQRRAGRSGAAFTLLKFRTMRGHSVSGREALDDAARMDSLGRFFRRTSIDELPQLVNVLRGEMSLVGPRPLLLDYLPLYSPSQQRRHEVRPGMTGLTQVSGRNALGWDEKFALDIWYVDNWSFWLDVKILLITARRVLFGVGSSAGDRVTMDRFEGNAGSPEINQPEKMEPRR